MRRVYVASAAIEKVGRHYDRGLVELAASTAFKVLDEAPVEPQAVVVANMASSTLSEQDNLGPLVASKLGLRAPSFKVEAADASGLAALLTAYSLVASGAFNSVLLVGVEKATEYPHAVVDRALSQMLDAEFEAYYGVTPAAAWALVMREYMRRFEVDRDTMSAWPVLMHENGLSNPYAYVRRRISRDDVARSQVVADPITLLDTAPVGDGSAAILLVSEEAARGDGLVEVRAVEMRTGVFELAARGDLASIPPLRWAAEAALRRAGVEAKQLDVIETHDVFTIAGVLSLEELGLAERGMAARLVAEGRFAPGDKPVVNPSGGLKSRGYPVGATAVYQTAEVYLQLIGEFPGVKVPGEIGAVVSIAGSGAAAGVAVLAR